MWELGVRTGPVSGARNRSGPESESDAGSGVVSVSDSDAEI